MGTTRIKVIDLSSEQEEVKTSRKHAEKLTGVAKLKSEKKPKPKPEEEVKKKQTEDISIKKEEPSKPSQTPAPPQPQPPQSSPKEKEITVPKEKPKRKRHLSKRYAQAKNQIETGKLYSAREAIELLTKTSTVKFDPTVELHLNVVDQKIKGSLNLPHPVTGKKKGKKYLVFSDKQEIASDKKIIWGDEKTIEEIEAGTLKPHRDFDIVIATPKFMPKLARVAKILGPAQVMPNPKNGTVVEDIAEALETKDSLGFEYKTEQNAPIIHTILGKLSTKPQDLEENLKTLIFAIGPAKIKKAVLKSTMSPAVKLDISSLAAK